MPLCCCSVLAPSAAGSAVLTSTPARLRLQYLVFEYIEHTLLQVGADSSHRRKDENPRGLITIAVAACCGSNRSNQLQPASWVAAETVPFDTCCCM
jgi:hypothetical protein